MPKTNALIHSFNSGELSKSGLARVDQEKVRLCAELQENLIPYTIGKAIMRPGTKYLGVLASSTTLTNTPPRIIPFVRSIATKYIVELNYLDANDESGEELIEYEDTTIINTIGTSSINLPSGSFEVDVKVIGGGADGSASGASSGGGGAYAATSAIAVSSGQTIYINVGDAGQDSWVNVSANEAPLTVANGALAKAGTRPYGGAAASCVGDVTYSGGDGVSSGTGYHGGPGGGGAAGVNGIGKAGGSYSGYAGGGGGGSNGGSSTAGGSSSSGGVGGNGTDGTGGGDGADGTLGGGGGGGSVVDIGGTGAGFDGGSDSTLATGYGSGGGGGGGGRNTGGNGGLYGGGGGSGARILASDGDGGYITTNYAGGLGAQGVAVVTVRYLASSISVSSDSGYMSIWRDDSRIRYGVANSTIGAVSTFTADLSGGATASLSATGFTALAAYSGGAAKIWKEVSTSSPNIEHAIKIVIAHGNMDLKIRGPGGEDDVLIAKTKISVGTHILSFTPTTSSYFVILTVSTNYTSELTEITIYNNAAIDLMVQAPWSLGTVRSIRYDQSLDTMFLSVPDSAPRKIERRGHRSWSVVEYLTTDGPFMTYRSDTNVRLKPSATKGDITLTASSSFFTDDHEGSLFKLTHDNLAATYGISAEGKFTPPFRQTGIVVTAGSNDDRMFSVVISGTWAGTLKVQRSFDDEYSGYRDYATITTNGTYNYNGSADDDNAITWYRVIFDSYTSGAAAVAITYGGYGGSGVCRITSVTNSTTATAEVLSDFYNTKYTDDWLEGEWNTYRGFPTAVALFDGRLWWARRDRFWGSESDNYYSFDVTVEGDAASIQRDVATGGTLAEVQWLLPLQRLVFGTAGAESSARPSSLDEPLTPKALTVKDGSTQGASDVTPLKIDGRGIFVQRSRRKLLELAYSPQINDYMATDLTRYNESICTSLNGARVTNLVDDDVIEISCQRHPDTYIWVLRDDAVIPAAIYNPTQEVTGWFRMTLGRSSTSFGSYLKNDKAVSTATLPSLKEDSVYFVVQRRTDPGTYSYVLEKMSNHEDCVYTEISDITNNEVNVYNGKYQLDSYETSVVASDGVTVPVNVRLAGSTVMVIGPYYDSSGNIDGYSTIGDSYVADDSGYITLSEFDEHRAGATVTVGLPYYGRYKSAKLAYGAQAGTSVSQKKRITDVSLLLSDYNPGGISIGPSFDMLDDLPAVIDGDLVEYDGELISITDTDMFPFPGEWSTDARVCIQIEPGCSATLNGLVIGVETNDQ